MDLFEEFCKFKLDGSCIRGSTRQHTRWYHCELTKLFSTTINVVSLSIIV